MSEPTKPEASPTAPATPKGPALPVVLGVAVAALAIGGVAGKFVVGPMLVHPQKAEAHAGAEGEEDAEEAGPGEKGGHGEKEGHGKKPMFRLDNVIVNPAGTDGSRYLMATVAIAAKNEETETRLREQEVQVRDVVVSILEAETLESLTRPGARDSMRVKIAAAVGPMAGGIRKIQVFLPQFILQ